MILITGANGIIGKAVAARLQQAKMAYAILDRKLLLQSTVQVLTQLLEKIKPDVIIHLAAAVPKPPSIADDVANSETTKTMDRLILQAATKLQCHVLYASGCSLYDKAKPGIKTEEDIDYQLKPESPYLSAKLLGEKSFIECCNATVLRISAPLAGDLPVSTVFGRFLYTSLSNGEIELWGSGNREQNYVDVDDIASAFLLAVEKRPQRIINIAADTPITMLDLAKKINALTGLGRHKLVNKQDPNEHLLSRYSNTLALELLGWRPSISIDESIRKAIKKKSEL